MHASASSDTAASVSVTAAWPAMSRQAMRTISRRRHSRSTRCVVAISLGVTAGAAARRS